MNYNGGMLDHSAEHVDMIIIISQNLFRYNGVLVCVGQRYCRYESGHISCNTVVIIFQLLFVHLVSGFLPYTIVATVAEPAYAVFKSWRAVL